MEDVTEKSIIQVGERKRWPVGILERPLLEKLNRYILVIEYNDMLSEDRERRDRSIEFLIFGPMKPVVFVKKISKISDQR